MPYQNVATYRDIVVPAVVQDGSGACQIDDRFGLAAGCLGCALIQNGFRFQLVAQGDAVEVLGDQILGGLGCKLFGGDSRADLEIVGIDILQRRNILLDLIYRRCAHLEIVDIHGCSVVALKVQIDLGHILGKAELDAGEGCPVAVAGLRLQVAVVALAAGIGVFHAQLDGVIPLGLCHSADGVLHPSLALVVQQELRTVPVLGSVFDAHGIRAAVCLFGGGGDGFHAASAGECRNIAVLESGAVDLSRAVIFGGADNRCSSSGGKCRGYRNCGAQHDSAQYAGSDTLSDFLFHNLCSSLSQKYSILL